MQKVKFDTFPRPVDCLKPYTAGKISTENLLDNVLTYISEHFCFYTLCIISAYKYVKKLRKCK